MDPLYPLSQFYDEAGLACPQVTGIEPAEMPDPYRRLLVHERDMTPTLEAAWGQDIQLRVLKYRLRNNVVSRQVVLMLAHDQTAVEMGAIKIYVDRFPKAARQLILERRKPLGTILRVHRIPHRSRPAGFFELIPDTIINEALRAGGTTPLFGRQNGILDFTGQVLAEALEILPPLDPFS